MCKWFKKVKYYRTAHNEKHMTISIDGKTEFDKIQQPFLISKECRKLKIEDF